MASPETSSAKAGGCRTQVTTISYTRPGIVAPVYITTNLTNPPWVIEEMLVSTLKTSDGDLIFFKRFKEVAPGSYEYKIRIGESEWVLDQNQETAPDGCGNQNNVKHVRDEPTPVAENGEEIMAVSNPDPTKTESPLLPHERFDASDRPTPPTQPILPEALKPDLKAPMPPPKRTATLPMETISESDESASASPGPQNDGSASADDQSEEDNELDNPALLPHEDENSEVTDAVPTVPLPVESGFIHAEDAPLLGHEDIPPVVEEDEEDELLLPYERTMRSPSTTDTTSEDAIGGVVIDDGQQLFPYESQLEAADGFETWALRDTSGSSSGSDQIGPNDGGRDRRDVSTTDNDGTQSAAAETDSTNPSNDTSGLNSRSSSEHSIAERTDGTNEWRTRSSLGVKATGMNNLGLFTHVDSAQKVPLIESLTEDDTLDSITGRHAQASASERMRLLIAPRSGYGGVPDSGHDKSQGSYILDLFRSIYDTFRQFFYQLFYRNARETSFSVLAVGVAFAVYHYFTT